MAMITSYSTIMIYQVHLLTESDISINSITMVGELYQKTILLQINVSLGKAQMPISFKISKLYYHLFTGTSYIALGKGYLLKSIHVSQSKNLSFLTAFQVFNVSRFINFLVKGESSIKIEGSMEYVMLGISSTMVFSRLFFLSNQSNSISLIEDLSLVQLHPIIPGTVFSLTINLVNALPLNITLFDARFQIVDNVKQRSLGNATLDQGGEVKLGENDFNGTFVTSNDLIGDFVQSFVAGGVINATIADLTLRMRLLGENVSIVTSYDLFLNTSSDVPQSFGSIRFNTTARSFDLLYKITSDIFWGFNITLLSFDIYHQFADENEMTHIGSAQLSRITYIPYNETTYIPIQVKIPLEWWPNLLLEYLNAGSLFIDIKNGETVITAYSDLNITVTFEQLQVKVL